jgi:hypothetical protein
VDGKGLGRTGGLLLILSRGTFALDGGRGGTLWSGVEFVVVVVVVVVKGDVELKYLLCASLIGTRDFATVGN